MESRSSLRAAHGHRIFHDADDARARPIEPRPGLGGRAILRLQQVEASSARLPTQIRCQQQFDNSDAMRTLIARCRRRYGSRRGGRLVLPMRPNARRSTQGGAEGRARPRNCSTNRARRFLRARGRQTTYSDGFRHRCRQSRLRRACFPRRGAPDRHRLDRAESCAPSSSA